MTLHLLMRDPAFRRLPKWLAVSVLNVLALAGLRSWLVAARGAEQTSDWAKMSLLVLSLWLPLGIYLVYVGHRPRYNRLDLSLPLPSRRLWTTHLVAVVLSGSLIIGVAIAVLELHKWGLGGWLGANEELLGPGLLDILPQFFAVLILAAVLYQSVQPAMQKLAVTPGSVMLGLVCLLGLFAALVLLCVVSPFWAVSPLILALLLGQRVWRTLPASLDLAPRRALFVAGKSWADVSVADMSGKVQKGAEADTIAIAVGGPGDRDASLTAGTKNSASGRWVLASTVVRTIYGSFKFMIYFPLLVILGLILSGLLFTDEPGEDLSLMYVPLIWYFLLAFVPIALKNLHQLDGLPVSRRRLFALLVLPSLGILVASYGVGKLLLAGKAGKQEWVRFEKFDDGHFVMVPLEYYEIAWDGKPPRSEAPWGETLAVHSAPLLKRASIAIYKPFTTGEASSLDFVAWQIGRALQAIYGTEIPVEEIKQRYLAQGPETKVVPKSGVLTIAADHPDLMPGGRGRWFPLLMLMITVPWLLLLALYLRGWRPGVTTFRRRVLQIGIMVLCMALYVGGPALSIADVWDIQIIMAFCKILARQVAEALPGGVPMMWLVAMALGFATYRWAARQFQRIEFPSPEQRGAE